MKSHFQWPLVVALCLTVLLVAPVMASPLEDDTSTINVIEIPTPLPVVLDDPSENIVMDLSGEDEEEEAETPVELITGMKALLVAIFGEYTPTTTKQVVTETVGNDTYQYIIDTVAPGAAAIDYVWLSGVGLFALVLYCGLKLLGGVVK